MTKEPDNVSNDYNYSRQTYYDLIERGKESLDLMIEVARESEHPRAFEVLSGMIKNVSDVNDKLMDLNKKNKDISAEDIKAIEKTTNNLFVGSTAELQRMLQTPDNDMSNVVDITPQLNKDDDN
ncbi:terminase [Alphaproteobacteria bacterium]|nr:terminase [Alphaproteobacteria bacterium]